MVKNPQLLKGIDRSFELRGESRLIWSVMTNWRLGNFFIFHFKGTPSQDQQKTFRRHLITFKVTLTDQSHFMLIFLLRKVILHINFVKWPLHPQASVPPPWTKGGGTPSPAVEGPIQTTGEKAWHYVYSVLCTKETQNPPTKWILLYTLQCTVALTQ